MLVYPLLAISLNELTTRNVRIGGKITLVSYFIRSRFSYDLTISFTQNSNRSWILRKTRIEERWFIRFNEVDCRHSWAREYIKFIVLLDKNLREVFICLDSDWEKGVYKVKMVTFETSYE